MMHEVQKNRGEACFINVGSRLVVVDTIRIGLILTQKV